MKKMLLLLATIIVLHLGSGFVLQAMYGDSFGFLAGEDCWRADGQGGWEKHGSPSEEMPSELSEDVPLLANYIPIFLPALVLIFFIFTPLSKSLEDEKDKKDDSAHPTNEATS